MSASDRGCSRSVDMFEAVQMAERYLRSSGFAFVDEFLCSHIRCLRLIPSSYLLYDVEER